MIPLNSSPYLSPSYLEDIIPLINFRPSASRHAKNMAEDQRRAMRDALDAQGLNPDSIAAIETVMRNERIDYNVSVTTDLLRH